MSELDTKFKNLLKTIKNYAPKNDLELVSLAFDFAKEAHKGQKRMSGEDYIFHPLATAQTLAEMKLSPAIIIAGLLHDIPEDTNYTLEDIRKNFGEEVSSLVEGITKLGSIKYRGIERYIENLRKMFIAIARDLRVILIKFADRLHNLRTLYALPRNKQIRIASEVMEIYSPIANRLGMYEMKGQLEEEAFKYLYPKEYNWLKILIEEQIKHKEKYLNKIIKFVKQELENEGIKNFEVRGRIKQLYSLYKKLLRHDKDINRVYDFIAIRIIVKNVPACYSVLGIIHKKMKPLKGRIKDYIAQPKPNGYSSLHTTVFTPEGEIIEIQIRTREMEEDAEYGIAAHWYYDEKGSFKPNKKTNWIEEITKWQKELSENQKFLEKLKIDVFQDRIFVFTPNGDVIDLPYGATPIDFAYNVHTDIGNQCVGALINNQIATLDKALKSGDVVEILTNKSRKFPNPDWLKFVKTSLARNKIKSSLSKRTLIDKFLKK
ncbi:MAG TPA: bifunctional (p)ppGpp synthetase/guanosine-3',5'-bis(diphosphate) 3'-pyrophosphohydrolase [Candidatus Uhrbacteria bacterium]|nr:bifunctional (p)ppGpp synthetase/guanosine-3',5'-bis(diphosphate) 3'-pyrophosphohydrolase [Candidatus Uhrbacteria bacterium]